MGKLQYFTWNWLQGTHSLTPGHSQALNGKTSLFHAKVRDFLYKQKGEGKTYLSDLPKFVTIPASTQTNSSVIPAHIPHLAP